jgi:hypothetical protein
MSKLTDFLGRNIGTIIGGAAVTAGTAAAAAVLAAKLQAEYDAISKDSNLGQSSYDFSYKYFPNDLTNDYVGHYMVININVPTTWGGNTPRGSYTGSSFQNVLQNEFSKVDVLRFGSGSSTAIAGAAAGARSSEALTLPRFTRRIKESIALFMPSSIVHTSQNMYEEVSMTAIAGKAAAIGVGVLAGAAAAGGGLKAAMSAGNFATNLTSAAGKAIGTAASIAKYPINPRIEVLYSTTPQRQFVFELMLAPRNEKESQSIEAIIKTLRFHAAPEIDSSPFGLDALGGFTLIPPAEFDITFFNKGVENTHIPRINTCVLERIEVDYSPQGPYSTFRNGHPVAVRLSLAFREVEMLHKQRVLQGF